jgi:plasmid stability protein
MLATFNMKGGEIAGPLRLVTREAQGDACVDINFEYYRLMGQILIRNLDDAVIAALRLRAAREGTSLEEEARRALARSSGQSREDFLRVIDEVRVKPKRVKGSSSLDILRASRNRDAK